MILINLSNQIGAGPRNISLNLIRAAGEAAKPEDVMFLTTDDPAICEAVEASGANFKIVSRQGIFALKFLRFVYVQLLLIWLTASGKFGGLLAFGNFLLVGKARRKAVLMHHPYLVDNALLAQLPQRARFMERVKRALFRWTLTRVDTVIVQSDYMGDMFRAVYPQYRGKLVVIPNPVSDTFNAILPHSSAEKERAITGKAGFTLVYASRFYPHKNHGFLIELARVFAARNIAIRLIVTLDPSIPGVDEFLRTVQEEALPIENIGEVSQTRLADVYQDADAAIFPSRAETFGNPLVEAIRFALPVVAPHKGYALAVLGDSGIYYTEDDAEQCAERCAALFAATDGYAQACRQAYSQGQNFPNSQEWYLKTLAVVDG